MNKPSIQALSYLFLLILVPPLFSIMGCTLEKSNPIATEIVGDENSVPEETYQMIIDARGFVGDVFQPADTQRFAENKYPVNYVGSWTLLNTSKSANWYMAISDTVGDEVHVIASATRVIFDFWDFEFYRNPGRVTFLVDGKAVGSFDLKQREADGRKINDYMVITGKSTNSTVTMRLDSGSVVITGYMLVFPKTN